MSKIKKLNRKLQISLNKLSPPRPRTCHKFNIDNYTPEYRISLSDDKLAIYLIDGTDKILNTTYRKFMLDRYDNSNVPFDPATDPSKTFEFTCGSIIINTYKNTHYFFGIHIYHFESEGNIVKYCQIAERGKLHPYGIDSNGNCYLFSDCVVFNDKNVLEHSENPYKYYDNYSVIISQDGTINRCDYSSVPNIERLYSGRNPIALCYDPFPSRYYNMLITLHGDTMYLVTKNDEIIKLDKELHKKILTSYSTFLNFKKIEKLMFHSNVVKRV